MSKQTAVAACLLATMFSASAGASIVTTFSWVPAVDTLTASTVIQGLQITLESDSVPFHYESNTFGFGAMIWEVSPGNDTKVTISFGQTVTEMRLFIQALESPAPPYSEALEDFSATPSGVDGDFYLAGGSVLSTIDGGQGNLYWTLLGTRNLSFTFNRGDFNGSGIWLNELEVSVAEVPTPSPVSLFASVLFGFAGAKRKMRKGASPRRAERAAVPPF